MMVKKIAQVPPPSVTAAAKVSDAVRVMGEMKGGACVVLEGDRLIGIFSERDLMRRVVAVDLDPGKIAVGEVMTRNPETVTTTTESQDALSFMVSRHIRHLPVVEENGNLFGLLSIRNLLHQHVEDLTDSLNSLEAYFKADGPGG